MRNHFLRASGVPSSGGIVDTDLEVHYDFGNTSCWTGNQSSNAADYTVNNLAKDYNDAFFRSRTGSSNSFRHDSSSPVIDFISSDGGGCFEYDSSRHTSDDDYCCLLVPGSNTRTVNSDFRNDAPTVTGSNNLFNGIGTGACTFEFWLKLDFSQSYTGYQSIMFAKEMGSGYGQSLSLYPSSSSDARAGTLSVYPPSGTNNNLTFSGSTNSGLSNWNHVVISRNSTSSNDCKVYLNNSLESTNTHNVNFTDVGYIIIGYGWGLSVSEYYSTHRYGIFRFYKGKALTSSEVTTNWNAQKSRFGH